MIPPLWILIFLHLAHAGDVIDTGQRIRVSPEICPKGIRCLSSRTYVLCENNDNYLAFGKRIFSCKGYFKCDENNPHNGCLHQQSYDNLLLDVSANSATNCDHPEANAKSTRSLKPAGKLSMKLGPKDDSDGAYSNYFSEEASDEISQEPHRRPRLFDDSNGSPDTYSLQERIFGESDQSGPEYDLNGSSSPYYEKSANKAPGKPPTKLTPLDKLLAFSEKSFFERSGELPMGSVASDDPNDSFIYHSDEGSYEIPSQSHRRSQQSNHSNGLFESTTDNGNVLPDTNFADNMSEDLSDSYDPFSSEELSVDKDVNSVTFSKPISNDRDGFPPWSSSDEMFPDSTNFYRPYSSEESLMSADVNSSEPRSDDRYAFPDTNFNDETSANSNDLYIIHLSEELPKSTDLKPIRPSKLSNDDLDAFPRRNFFDEMSSESTNSYILNSTKEPLMNVDVKASSSEPESNDQYASSNTNFTDESSGGSTDSYTAYLSEKSSTSTDVNLMTLSEPRSNDRNDTNFTDKIPTESTASHILYFSEKPSISPTVKSVFSSESRSNDQYASPNTNFTDENSWDSTDSYTPYLSEKSSTSTDVNSMTLSEPRSNDRNDTNFTDQIPTESTGSHILYSSENPPISPTVKSVFSSESRGYDHHTSSDTNFTDEVSDFYFVHSYERTPKSPDVESVTLPKPSNDDLDVFLHTNSPDEISVQSTDSYIPYSFEKLSTSADAESIFSSEPTSNAFSDPNFINEILEESIDSYILFPSDERLVNADLTSVTPVLSSKQGDTFPTTNVSNEISDASNVSHTFNSSQESSVSTSVNSVTFPEPPSEDLYISTTANFAEETLENSTSSYFLYSSKKPSIGADVKSVTLPEPTNTEKDTFSKMIFSDEIPDPSVVSHTFYSTEESSISANVKSTMPPELLSDVFETSSNTIFLDETSDNPVGSNDFYSPKVSSVSEDGKSATSPEALPVKEDVTPVIPIEFQIDSTNTSGLYSIVELGTEVTVRPERLSTPPDDSTGLSTHSGDFFKGTFKKPRQMQIPQNPDYSDSSIFYSAEDFFTSFSKDNFPSSSVPYILTELSTDTHQEKLTNTPATVVGDLTGSSVSYFSETLSMEKPDSQPKQLKPPNSWNVSLRDQSSDELTVALLENSTTADYSTSSEKPSKETSSDLGGVSKKISSLFDSSTKNLSDETTKRLTLLNEATVSYSTELLPTGSTFDGIPSTLPAESNYISRYFKETSSKSEYPELDSKELHESLYATVTTVTSVPKTAAGAVEVTFTTEATTPLPTIFIPSGLSLRPSTATTDPTALENFKKITQKKVIYGGPIFVRYYRYVGIEIKEIGSDKLNLELTSLYDVLTSRNLTVDEIAINRQNLPIFKNRYLGAFDGKMRLKLSLTYSVNKLERGLFNNVSGIIEFEVTNSNLRTITDGVFTGQEQKALKLSDNRISTIEPTAFDNMPYLRIVDLSNNRLSFFDSNWFSNCPQLIWIYMSNNRIKTLPSMVFKNLNHFQPWVLRLDHNQITEVSDDIFIKEPHQRGNKSYFKSLRINTLSLKGNSIMCIGKPEQILVPYFTDLQENPLACSCRLKMIRYSKRYRTRSVQVDSTCVPEY